MDKLNVNGVTDSDYSRKNIMIEKLLVFGLFFYNMYKNAFYGTKDITFCLLFIIYTTNFI